MVVIYMPPHMLPEHGAKPSITLFEDAKVHINNFLPVLARVRSWMARLCVHTRAKEIVEEWESCHIWFCLSRSLQTSSLDPNHVNGAPPLWSRFRHPLRSHFSSRFSICS